MLLARHESRALLNMPSDCEFWWNWWVNFAVAFGTLLVAAIALFGDKFRAKFFPPRLELKIRSKDGEKTQLTDQNGLFVDDTRYYYILVSNSRRWSPAKTPKSFLRDSRYRVQTAAFN